MKSVEWDIGYTICSDADDVYSITVKAATEFEAVAKASRKIKNLRKIVVANPRWVI